MPAELRFGAVGRSLPAVALCQHCVLLRGEERLRLIRVEQRRLVDEVDFPPEEALMSAEKKYPDYEAPPEPIKPPTPQPVELVMDPPTLVDVLRNQARPPPAPI